MYTEVVLLIGRRSGPNFKPTAKNIVGVAIIGGMCLFGQFIRDKFRKDKIAFIKNEKCLTESYKENEKRISINQFMSNKNSFVSLKKNL